MITKDKIEKILRTAFQPQYLFVGDDSFRHAGHAEALLSGGKHFSVTIVSEKFKGLSNVKRHQMVYDTLRHEMGKGIHALAIQTRTPEEHAQK